MKEIWKKKKVMKYSFVSKQSSQSNILFYADFEKKILMSYILMIRKLMKDKNNLWKSIKHWNGFYIGIFVLSFSIPYQIFITIITLLSLFADDIRIVAFNQPADIGFDVLSMIMIIIFLTEIVLSWIAFE